MCADQVVLTFSAWARFDMPDAELQVKLGTPDNWCAVGWTRKSIVANQPPVEFTVNLLYLTDADNQIVLGEGCPLPFTTSRIEWRASVPNTFTVQWMDPGPIYTFTAP